MGQMITEFKLFAVLALMRSALARALVNSEYCIVRILT
jgi:hypothetical protein